MGIVIAWPWLQEAEGPAALLWGGECCPQRDLEEYTHISVAACALLLRMTLLWAPRAVMNMSFCGKHLQLRLDGEVRNAITLSGHHAWPTCMSHHSH